MKTADDIKNVKKIRLQVMTLIHLYEKKINRKVRVFISSTFSDMQKERNIIVHSVFPRLRRAFHTRLIDITEVDLRWGIPEDDVENSRILEICIGEVLHCYPFFVGMVGDRYGTLASEDSINSLPPAYKRALGEEIPSGLSITELEMRAGVFVPNNVDFSCFFIKNDTLQDEKKQPEISKLISNISQSYEMYTYANGSEFEEALYNSLYNYISRVIPERLTIPYDDKSYFSHLKILKNNNYRYEADNYFITGIERKINHYRRVYILGDKGLGKSACLSYLVKEEGLERDGRVFFHFASAGSQSVNVENIFFRLRLFLQEEFDCRSIEEDNYNAVIDILSSDTVNERTVLFFDAMDQLDDTTAIYKFFALADLNQNIYIVCSGINEFSRIMGDQVVRMQPLSDNQISQITNGTLTQFGKKLSRKMKQDILKKENCSNPLFLRAFLSQLIMYGTYATFDTFFYMLLDAEDFGQLFSTVISRIKGYFTERNIDEKMVYLALGLMVYSSNGVKESEIQEMLNIIPVARSVFLTAINLFTIEDNGLIRFNHDLIYKSAKNILEDTNEQYEEIVSEMFISYFSNSPDDWRKYSELPFQLCKMRKASELLDQISDPKCFRYLCKYEFHSLIGYLSYLVDRQTEITSKLIPELSDNERIKLAEIMCLSGCHKSAISILSNLLEKETDSDTKIHILDIMARSEYKLALNNFQTSIDSYFELISYYLSVYPDDEIGYASRAYLLGVAYKSSGYLALSASILEECAEIYQRHNICNATSAWVFDVYGEACYTSGKLKKAIEILDKVISDCTYLFGNISPELAWAYCYGWNTLYVVGDKTNALNMIHKAYEIYDQLYMGKGSKVAWASVNEGTAYMLVREFEKAEQLYLFSISENDCIIPEENRPHVYSLTTYADLAALYENTNRHEKAVETIRFSVEQSIQKNGANHIYTANIILSCGIIEKDVTKVEDALIIYKNQKFETPDMYFAQVCLARLYALIGSSDKADEVITQCKESYFCEDRETDLITYLILDTFEKISGDLSEDMADELDELYRFDDYDYYLTHNNNSQIIMIPKI